MYSASREIKDSLSRESEANKSFLFLFFQGEGTCPDNLISLTSILSLLIFQKRDAIVGFFYPIALWVIHL